MRSELALFGLLAACSFRAPAGDPATGDAAADGAVDAPRELDACAQFSQQLDTCMLPAGTPLVLSGILTYNTDTGRLTDSGAAVVPVVSVTSATHGDEVEAIVATTVMFAPGTQLRVIGGRGFAIVAGGAITLGGGAVIDASVGGAGARASCANGPAAGENDSGGGAGGGGGGFGAAGGKGGNGNADSSDSIGGRGGDGVAVPAGPVGGCPGAKGGTGGDAGGAGGAGGGAVYLVSAIRIELAATAGIRAGGGGGAGGTKQGSQFGDAGGGGGGSGGMILVEAPVIRSVGILAANGGGGGEASGNGNAGNPGAAGALGIETAPGGKDGSPTGTDGGNGGFRLTPAGGTQTAVQNGGGGGGGGGAGFVHVVSPDAMLGTLVSPTPS